MNTFYSVMSLVIGAGMFLTGIVMFSESLEKNASRSTSALFKKISNNRLAGFGIGAGITAIIQSSTATTVTVVGLVNAGILTLQQTPSIMLGAHVGATSTLFLVSLSAFDIKYVFMTLGFAGALMKILTKRGRIVRIADLCVSFGILFVGLHLMGNALKDNEDLREFFIALFKRIEFPPLLVLLGMVFTVIVQSSTASKSLFLMMIVEGLLGFDSALFLSLGAVIGSTSTAIFASFTADAEAKRAALVNFFFGVTGAIIFTGIIWPLKSVIVPVYEAAIPLAWQLPVFLLFYNLAVAFILIWFVDPLSRLASRLIKDKPDTRETIHTTYIDDRLLATPSIAVEQTKKEIMDMMTRVRANLVLSFNALLNQDFHKKRIKREEEVIDFLNRAIAKFIIKLSGSDVSESDDNMLAGFCNVINDVERVGDYAIKIHKDAGRMKKNDYKFSKKALGQLQEMSSRVLELFDLCMEIFENRDIEKLQGVSALEGEINLLKSKFALGHMMWLKAGQYILEGGEYLYSAISDLERVAHHLANVALSVSYSPGVQTGMAEAVQEAADPLSGDDDSDPEEAE